MTKVFQRAASTPKKALASPWSKPARPNTDAKTDAELVEASRRGSWEAFNALVERHQSTVFSLAFALSRNIPESEEVAQETFVIAWRQLGHLKTPDSFRAWLGAITRNLIRIE